MIKKNILQTISAKEMDRKDFLKYSGLILLSLVGLKGLVTFLAKPEVSTTANTTKTSRGFGSGKYGA